MSEKNASAERELQYLRENDLVSPCHSGGRQQRLSEAYAAIERLQGARILTAEQSEGLAEFVAKLPETKSSSVELDSRLSTWKPLHVLLTEFFAGCDPARNPLENADHH